MPFSPCTLFPPDFCPRSPAARQSQMGQFRGILRPGQTGGHFANDPMRAMAYLRGIPVHSIYGKPKIADYPRRKFASANVDMHRQSLFLLSSSVAPWRAGRTHFHDAFTNKAVNCIEVKARMPS